MCPITHNMLAKVVLHLQPISHTALLHSVRGHFSCGLYVCNKTCSVANLFATNCVHISVPATKFFTAPSIYTHTNWHTHTHTKTHSKEVFNALRRIRARTSAINITWARPPKPPGSRWHAHPIKWIAALNLVGWKFDVHRASPLVPSRFDIMLSGSFHVIGIKLMELLVQEIFTSIPCDHALLLAN